MAGPWDHVQVCSLLLTGYLLLGGGHNFCELQFLLLETGDDGL